MINAGVLLAVTASLVAKVVAVLFANLYVATSVFAKVDIVCTY